MKIMIIATPPAALQGLAFGFPVSSPVSRKWKEEEKSRIDVKVSAAKPGGFSLNSILSKCGTCEGKRAIECPGCKGTGKNKKNGNIFERWKCFECRGFGLKGCPSCGDGGLTPEQRGER
ncbi:unnamed protein product [Linum tenue]|uniref:Uncharacterized protein n=1 Tax=Linum tenue TaxID=586396 RepID=A0AAV0HJH7_9ROSI|nr:unnamed protein product [Linum tenue]